MLSTDLLHLLQVIKNENKIGNDWDLMLYTYSQEESLKILKQGLKILIMSSGYMHKSHFKVVHNLFDLSWQL